jgi:hypothetical protein
MWERAIFAAALVFGAGCSIVVEDQIGLLPVTFDAGRTVDDRDNCNTTQDCMGVTGREIDCHVQCVLSDIDGRGHCERSIDVNAPDGVFCGTGDEDQVCVDGTCVTRACGDGFVDRRGPNPEYCDPNAPGVGTCDPATCLRLCETPAPSTCPVGGGLECWGGAGTCDDSFEMAQCTAATAVEDGTSCTLAEGGTGECEAGVCVQRLP